MLSGGKEEFFCFCLYLWLQSLQRETDFLFFLSLTRPIICLKFNIIWCWALHILAILLSKVFLSIYLKKLVEYRDGELHTYHMYRLFTVIYTVFGTPSLLFLIDPTIINSVYWFPTKLIFRKSKFFLPVSYGYQLLTILPWYFQSGILCLMAFVIATWKYHFYTCFFYTCFFLKQSIPFIIILFFILHNF